MRVFVVIDKACFVRRQETERIAAPPYRADDRQRRGEEEVRGREGKLGAAACLHYIKQVLRCFRTLLILHEGPYSKGPHVSLIVPLKDIPFQLSHEGTEAASIQVDPILYVLTLPPKPEGHLQ